MTRAYQAIEKAKHQLDLLQPIIRWGGRYRERQETINRLQGAIEAVPAYFAQQKQTLLRQAVSQAEQNLEQAQYRLADENQRLEQLRGQAQELAIAISNDEVGRQLQTMERDIQEAQNRLSDKQAQAKRYNELAQQLKLPPYQDEATFYQSRQKSLTYVQGIEAQRNVELEKQVQAATQRHTLQDHFDELSAELDSLRQRESQIPATNLKIRSRLLQALNIPEADVPFIGELLQVKREAHPWEGAIERLLHNFGLRLLVPDTHYAKISRYVDQTHLRGRLVFHRVTESRLTPPHRSATQAVPFITSWKSSRIPPSTTGSVTS